MIEGDRGKQKFRANGITLYLMQYESSNLRCQPTPIPLGNLDCVSCGSYAVTLNLTNL
jgi:hypothetical protein